VPIASVVQQVLELDRLGYRYRLTVYPFEDHIAWALEDEFDDPVSHMGTALRQGDPRHITFAWYPQLVRPDLGIGPHRVRWSSDLTADPDTAAARGVIASVDARSYARRDPTRTTRRRRGFEPDLDPSPGLYIELLWRTGSAVDPLPYLTLHLTRVASLIVDVARAGLASLPASTINVVTDTPVLVTLATLPPNTTVAIDGQPAGPSVAVPVGRHTITLSVGDSEVPSGVLVPSR